MYVVESFHLATIYKNPIFTNYLLTYSVIPSTSSTVLVLVLVLVFTLTASASASDSWNSSPLVFHVI
jgi:hypothetical protein